MEALLNNPDLLRIGLELMKNSQPAAGSTVGPTFAGAAGQTGINVMDRRDRIATQASAAALAREKFDEDKRQFDEKQATEQMKIEGDQALRELQNEIRAAQNEISNQLAQTRNDLLAAGQGDKTAQHKETMALRFLELKRKVEDDLSERMKSDPKLAFDKDAQEKERAKATKEIDALRKDYGITAKDVAGAEKTETPGQVSEEIKTASGRYRVKDGKVQKWTP